MLGRFMDPRRLALLLLVAIFVTFFSFIWRTTSQMTTTTERETAAAAVAAAALISRRTITDSDEETAERQRNGPNNDDDDNDDDDRTTCETLHIILLIGSTRRELTEIDAVLKSQLLYRTTRPLELHCFVGDEEKQQQQQESGKESKILQDEQLPLRAFLDTWRLPFFHFNIYAMDDAMRTVDGDGRVELAATIVHKTRNASLENTLYIDHFSARHDVFSVVQPNNMTASVEPLIPVPYVLPGGGMSQFSFLHQLDGLILRAPVSGIDCFSKINEPNAHEPTSDDDDNNDDGLPAGCEEIRLPNFHIWPHYFSDAGGRDPGDGDDIVLVTQFSIDRLASFDRLLKAWRGPISVAIYTTSRQLAILDDWLDGIDMSKRSSLVVHLVFQEGAMYPINVLRNVAMRYSLASHVFVFDVDFVPHPIDLYDQLLTKINRNSLEVLVIPAFEVVDSEKKLMPNMTKSNLKSMYPHSIRAFHITRFSPAHRYTDYKRWFTADAPYEAIWHTFYEPYIIAERSLLSEFNEQLVGYGENKVSFIKALHENGIRFMVSPVGWLLHMAHGPTLDLLRWNRERTFHRCIHEAAKKP